MMRQSVLVVFIVLLVVAPCAAADHVRWSQLPRIPDAEGFAGSFAGVVDGVLVVAGGSNFPEARPWEGGTKVWYATVYVLDRPDGKWRKAGKLPRALAYGISITTDDGLLCIGGADAGRHYAECFLLGLSEGKVKISKLPAMPRPCAYACGARVGDTIYVAGGTEKADDTKTLHTFWSLDLGQTQSRWVEREPWPGPECMLAAAGAHEGSFFLFGGTSLEPGQDGKPLRTYLRNAYCYAPATGWRKIAKLPRPAVAAPSPAAAVAPSHLLVIGGDDGTQIDNPQQSHRGFPRDVLAYDTATDTWTTQANVPFSLVTTPLVRWKERIVIAGGEAKPGVRSTDVWSGEVGALKHSSSN